MSDNGIYERVRDLLRRRRRRLTRAESAQVESVAAVAITAGGGGGGPGPGPGPNVMQHPGASTLQGVQASVVDAAIAGTIASGIGGPDQVCLWASVVRPAGPGVLVDEHFDTGPGVLVETGPWTYSASNAFSVSPNTLHYDEPGLSDALIEVTMGTVDATFWLLYGRSSTGNGDNAGSRVHVQTTGTGLNLVERHLGANVDSLGWIGTINAGDRVGLEIRGATARALVNGAVVSTLGLTVLAAASGYWGIRRNAASNRGIDRLVIA